ncbi:L-threonylcarbamoyladenylate synthase [Thiobacter aerophilum]|uniref:Threonylcarbamoyl-AMP synthase n=1 Tax=Thiobacter aerophilum TaxID=3121275 RepID=A0ABV0EGI2_9BURK
MPRISTDLDRAVALLRAGGVVAIPTETVYGLAADARNPAAVRRVFAIKGRPADHPLIVHIAAAEAMPEWARDIPEAAWRLARHFWPGPLTLILQRAPGVPDEVTGGQNTVGLRVPDHPLTLELLRRFGGGLAAPSANRFGRISPTRPEHVVAELDEAIDLILDGGPCSVGVESTIVDLTGRRPTVLRPGRVSLEALEHVLGEPVALSTGEDGVRAPGTLAAHYAPATPVLLLPLERLWEEAARRVAAGERVGVLTYGLPRTCPGVFVLRLPGQPAAYARELYAALRAMDEAGYACILVETVPETSEWLAVANRLKRAATAHR